MNEIPEENRWKCGRGHRKYCYTKAEIVKRSGRSIWSVRRDIRLGKLDPYDFEQVAEYCKKWREK